MSCASCGTMLPEHALFCPGCGQRITVQRRVPAAVGGGAPEQRPFDAPAPAPAIPRDELEAALAAREELGDRMEPEVVQAFLNRVERAIDGRVDARLGGRVGGYPPRAEKRQGDGFTARIAASLALGIPITAIAGGIADGPGVIAALVAIVTLNIYYTEVERERDRRGR